MPESLLEKYPHLKLLRSSVSGEHPASPPSAVDSDAAPSLRRPMSAMTGSKEESPVAAVLRNRKSILGPGVGARLDRKPIVKPHETASRRRVNAEDLFAESVAADNDQWLAFQIEKIPASQQMEQLKMWLASNKPSQVTRESGIGWIAIKMSDRSGKNLAAKAEWDSLEGEMTMEIVNSIAAKHGVTGGKWLYHLTRDRVDKVWAKLAMAMFSGGLGPTVYMVKVSPSDMSPGSKGEHVVCVYNPDYQDTNQVMRVENLLRSAGAVGDLLYKPDIFSTLGIYRNNKWGFRPTIYTSRVILNEGRSKINIVGSEKFYINSSKGFEKPDSLDMQKLASQITASMSKPTSKAPIQPTKEHIADEALAGMLDLVDKSKDDEEKKAHSPEKSETPSPEKSLKDDVIKKLGELGLKNMDEFTSM